MTFAPSSLTGGDRSRDNRSPTESHDILTALPRHSATRCITGTVALAAALLASAHPALADFRLCNNTGSRVGVSLGYKDAEGWTRRLVERVGAILRNPATRRAGCALL